MEAGEIFSHPTTQKQNVINGLRTQAPLMDDIKKLSETQNNTKLCSYESSEAIVISHRVLTKTFSFAFGSLEAVYVFFGRSS